MISTVQGTQQQSCGQPASLAECTPWKSPSIQRHQDCQFQTIYSPQDWQSQKIYIQSARLSNPNNLQTADSQSRQFKSLQDCHSQKIYSLQDCSSPAITGPHDYLGSRITLKIPGDYYCPRQSTVRKTVNPCTNNCSKIKYCRTRLPILGKFWLKEQQIFLRTVDLRNAHDQIPGVAPLVLTQDCFNPRTCTGPLMSYVEMKHR